MIFAVNILQIIQSPFQNTISCHEQFNLEYYQFLKCILFYLLEKLNLFLNQETIF